MRKEFAEKIYAGWLAKIIGIRLGAPIEGWTYQKIKDYYGEITDYLINYRDFAADDDSNGPLFFLRALEEGQNGIDMTAQDVAESLLNYAPYEHGFFWWGGYGTSTEHTAYLNLRNGIKAPLSGSIEQNGATVAEQIGGQIFIDTWGLVAPGNPDLAAKLAKKAASVTHGGNGIYGGIFIAVCISTAFIEKDIEKIIEKGLSYIPRDCEYSSAVRSVLDYCRKNPSNWRDCYDFIFSNWGYAKYPGNCHIIPNSCLIVLSLLYGCGSFSDTLNICNMCGWDTDCNVGNVAAIIGVRNGLEDIDFEKWRKPVNDLLICSSVVGTLNIQDIPYGASYMVKLACLLSDEAPPEPYDEIIGSRIYSCHFEYPGSTHAIRIRKLSYPNNESETLEALLKNSTEKAYSGVRSLKVIAKSVKANDKVLVYKKTYYHPKELHDSRYDPSFSPLVYPGQTVNCSLCIPSFGPEFYAALYVHECYSGTVITGPLHMPVNDKWERMSWAIPHMDNCLFDEMGVCITVKAGNADTADIVCFIDDLYTEGNAAYSIDFEKSREDLWNGLHREISQFTRLKGLMYLDGDCLNLSGTDFAEAYTGHHEWTDYSTSFSLEPVTGMHHLVNARVQGAIRSYAAGLLPNGKAGILKNANGYSLLAETDFQWSYGTEYQIMLTVKGDTLSLTIDGKNILSCHDDDHPYTRGAIGVTVLSNSHCRYKRLKVEKA